MHYFTAVVHKDSGSAYGLTFPDLPGCHAAADDWSDIPQAAAEALDLWFEDAKFVAPAALDAVRQFPGVADALADGASLLVVPYILPEGAPVRANISLDRGLLQAIDDTARARNMTRSSFLGSLARREITGV